jgi:hypothetical protein
MRWAQDAAVRGGDGKTENCKLLGSLFESHLINCNPMTFN